MTVRGAAKEAGTTSQPDPMKYVDWVDRVLQASGELTRADADARLIGVPWDQVLRRLGWPSDPSSPIPPQSPQFEALGDVVMDLSRLGLVERGGAGSPWVRLTQEGRRLAAQSLRSIWPEIFAIYLDDEQLAFLREATALSEDRQADYARVDWVPWQKVFDTLGWRIDDNGPAYDIHALATTKSSGERYFVVGFDDATRQFSRSVDPAITQNRLEQILNAYAAPAPEIRYQRVAWGQGEIGVVKVLRDPARIPYRVMQTVAHITQGDIFVRHGSQAEPPTQAERDALEAEGQAAASTGP